MPEDHLASATCDQDAEQQHTSAAAPVPVNPKGACLLPDVLAKLHEDLHALQWSPLSHALDPLTHVTKNTTYKENA